MLRVFNQHRQPDLRTRLTRRVHGSDPMEVDEAQADEEGKIGSRAYVSLLSVSPDGQWLASSDADGKSFVFHMDSLRVSRLHEGRVSKFTLHSFIARCPRLSVGFPQSRLTQSCPDTSSSPCQTIPFGFSTSNQSPSPHGKTSLSGESAEN